MVDWFSYMGDWNIFWCRFWGLLLFFYFCMECGYLMVIGFC